MSSGAFTRQLVHTCTIQKPNRVQNAIGEEVSTYVDYLTGVACRYVVKREKIANEKTGLQMLTTYSLLLPDGTDIAAKDRITNIVLEGETEPGPFEIEEVVPRRNTRGMHHISLVLEKLD